MTKYPAGSGDRRECQEVRHSDEDILHAARNAMRAVPQADRVLLIGPDRDAQLLEIVVLDPDDDPVVIHADILRPKFHRYL